MRMRSVIAAAAAAGALALLTAAPAHATEYNSPLKLKGIQYNPPGSDSNSCSTGNTSKEYLTIKNYSSVTTVNLRGYVVLDAAGNRFAFPANHYLEPGDYVVLRGGNGADSDAGNVAYRDNCNHMWNNDKDRINLYKPTGAGADAHSYSATYSDRDRNGYVKFHG